MVREFCVLEVRKRWGKEPMFLVLADVRREIDRNGDGRSK
jgi:hypothetical protein